jgi:hypothetical protein
MNVQHPLARIAATCLAVVALFAPTTSQAEERWEATFKTSAFYDSQLVIEETDVSREAGDVGIKIGANLAFKPVDTDTLDAKVSYDFGQTLHSEFDEFDLQTHRVDVSMTRKVGKVRLGLRADATHVQLAGDPFLDIYSASPSVSAFLTDHVFLRAHARFAEKQFDDLERRNASTQQAGVNLFRFHKNGRGYLLASAQVEREDANDPVLDYDGIKASVTFKHPLNADKNAPSFKLTADYRERDYDLVTPSIGEEREERRYRAGADLETNLTSNLRIEVGYNYTDRNSNLPSANYIEHRVETGLVLRL